MKPFGSLEVIDRKTDQFRECDPATCPKAEKIHSTSRLASDDGASDVGGFSPRWKIDQPRPLLMERGIRHGNMQISPEAKDLMWDFYFKKVGWSYDFIWICLKGRKRHLDAIWEFDKEELMFDDPPEIAGRGTFGLVVKAEGIEV